MNGGEERDSRDKRLAKYSLFLLLLLLHGPEFLPSLELDVHSLFQPHSIELCTSIYEAPGFMIFVFLHVKTSKS